MDIDDVIEDVMEMIELHKDGCLITTEYDFENLEILLNHIKKQQKEIEELKTITDLWQNASNNIGEITQTIINKNYISKDKIKAKIGEIKKHIEDMRNITRRKTDRVECRLMSDVINEYLKAEKVLQSLLDEKE